MDTVAQSLPNPRRPFEAAPPIRRRPQRQLKIVWHRILLAVAIFAALVAAAVSLAGVFVAKPAIKAVSPEPRAVLGELALDPTAFVVDGADDALRNARWSLDGSDVTDRARIGSGTATLTLGSAAEGPHTLVVSSSGSLPWSTMTLTWKFVVDTTPPEISLAPEALVAERGQPHELSGTVEPDVTLELAGTDVSLADGAFTIAFEQPPRQALHFVARDAAGNESEELVTVAVLPRRPDAPVRGVHVSAPAWADAPLREEILRLVDEDLINTVQLDLKDERGEVGYDSEVELGHLIGAVRSYYDLDAAVSTLHAKGVRVIGRLVVFRDPILADWAWSDGRHGLVVQTPTGEPYAGYGGFTNLASLRVRDYNMDIAEEAAQRGVDDILYDYVRRPDGPIESMTFPGLSVTPEAALITFLEETESRLRPYNTYLGASVFGIAALRPQDVAQDVPRIAGRVDYVAPMVYPSHWSAGVYDVDDPNGDPYEIVLRSLEDFSFKVEGQGARVLPWLQDFSLGITYGPEEVRAQIEGARAAGIDEWLLWDPDVTYTSDALEPRG